MPGISELYEHLRAEPGRAWQSLLTANTVWGKLTRPVFRPGRTPSLRGPLVRKIPTAVGFGVLLSGIIDQTKRAQSMSHAGE
jgi:hypothetical protein